MILEEKAQNFLIDGASWICSNYVETGNSTICEGATHIMGEIVLPSLTKFLLGPEYLCSQRVLGYCDSPTFVELKAQDYIDEQMSLKKPELESNDFIDKLYDEISADPNQRETIKIVQLADAHLDAQYLEGTIADCNLPICCRKNNGFTTDASIRAGKWGDYKCDTPIEVYLSMLQFVKEEIKPDVFIWTGDNSPHDIWQNTRD